VLAENRKMLWKRGLAVDELTGIVLSDFRPDKALKAAIEAVAEGCCVCNEQLGIVMANGLVD